MSNTEETKSTEKSKAITNSADKNISITSNENAPAPLIADDQIRDFYAEAIDCIRSDRAEAEERYLHFADMIINGGDPSSATKEAMVNLLKLKNDGVNQMIKVLDLWTRISMKDKATSSQVYAFQQNNKYEVDSNRPNPHVKRLIQMAKDMENNDESK